MDLDEEEVIALYRQYEAENPSIAPHSCPHCQRFVIDFREPINRSSGCTVCAEMHEFLPTDRSRDTGLILLDLFNGAFGGCDLFANWIARDRGLKKLFCKMTAPLSATELDAWGLALQAELKSACVAASTEQHWQDLRGYELPEKPFEAHDVVLWVPIPQENELSVTFILHPKQTSKGQLPCVRGQPKSYLGSFELYRQRTEYQFTSPSCSGRYRYPRFRKQTVVNRFQFMSLPPNLTSGTELTQMRVKAWLRNCKETHTRCKSYATSFHPKRLLEISEDGKSVVLRSCQSSAPYAALSYCWGSDQATKTTAARLEEYSMPFSPLQLPATLRDAISTAHSLGLRHIWIDSMCIVQDDSQDLQEQLGQMHEIFRGAVITIVAARAKSTSDGFLQLRPHRKPYILVAHTDAQTRVTLAFIPAANTTSIMPIDSCDPIFRRGWAFQELRVSPRLLSFGTDETEFCCLETHLKDGGYRAFLSESPQCRGGLRPGLLETQPLKHPFAWVDLVRTYSPLKMSEETDRLPALGALAESYKRMQNVSEYHSGLWSEDFLWQLLWKVDRPAQRGPTYCGPTWSWCSLPAEAVAYPRWGPAELRTTSVLVNVRENLLSALNPYGEVRNARITIRGYTRPSSWIAPSSSRSSKHGRLRLGRSASSSTTSSLRTDDCHRIYTSCPYFFAMDVGMHGPPDSEAPLLALEIGIDDPPGWDGISDDKYRYEGTSHGLLLRELAETAGGIRYERVGIFNAPSKPFVDFPDSLIREVVIL